ncbi:MULTISPECIES: phosphoribosylaminoimidazolesuccinocarboxamide synthase [Dehalobacter]|jgi:phosphoribosylaminoimidazole-succinocarboxamide synthase|uniref:Phosphoribosylaminoimidazole-succinocarboxamide synthase n=1 Tax=Dehalobacter restrictus (strain DSM 9455 / PER-K23) TaxID=871738 RepID=A0ABN4BTY0_DEHRP|nr:MULTISPECIES: phosphoribosylaminoimidazolesuccinocarboxamide synthase [Dehalobacter]AHF09522.1 phosphoribosylaminoimidazole-succinocarboxamide synthase [Dehalobacter restrictus DSM 9455]MCG1025568.1 phosphoribosylaminoimidazolesuccinocarboxamide synthase [Dehalobacter sp.]MDJ0306296.1 phosphoribosylaminoimidazolesuccinocarboxamide synthase [Dehalobacter sp.]OCZ54869.1 phosphoribosylaminoimidazolesuccinocarboxamide synthase [Dehalobacter sp. TeCB1]
MEKLAMLYEGKAKKIYDTNDKNVFWVEYKDDATAFNGIKKGTIVDKGIINNKMSAMMFSYLQKNGVDTHFVELLSDREQIVRRLQMVPLEIVVRNIVAGSLVKKVGKEEGYSLASPVLELYYKDDALGDPMVNETHALAMGWATIEQINKMKEIALKVNELMTKIVAKAGIDLVDYKLEFGLIDGKVMLGDEISPDTCRFWDKDTGEKLDKDRFRRDLGKIEEAYAEVYTRLKDALENA